MKKFNYAPVLVFFLISSAFADGVNPDYIRVKQLFDQSIADPASTVSQVCAHEWSANAYITENHTETPTYANRGIVFCLEARDPVTGAPSPVARRSLPVQLLGTYSPVDDFVNRYIFQNIDKHSWGTESFSARLGVNAKTWNAVMSAPIGNRERRSRGISKSENEKATLSVVCTVTQAPLALVCREKSSYSWITDKYTTFYKVQ